MKSITPTEFEALPEAEKGYWDKHPMYGRKTGEDCYIPVMIPLADACDIVRNAIFESSKAIRTKSSYDILTEALTKLKNLNGNDK